MGGSRWAEPRKRRGNRSRPASSRCSVTRTSRTTDRRVGAVIAGWFAANARPLPWRLTPRVPYLSLVSEFMLQQTQVARVLEKFGPFIDRFPDLGSLAGARESDVLAE